MLIVDVRHWMDERGDIPLKPAGLRRNALRVAQLIEYAASLRLGETRETLVPCSKRPNRKPCPGLLWVAKEGDNQIYAYCIVCQQDEVVISGWEDTVWAEGMMPPVRVPSVPDADDPRATRH